MEYQVVVESDAETGHFTATVPGFPIVVDGETKEETVRLAREAILLYLEEAGMPAPPALHAELVTVEV